MKTHILRTTIFVLGLFAIVSCGQDPIFWIISKETPPLKPYIPGTPTNMVIFKRGDLSVLVVASGSKIYCYRQGTWNSGVSIPEPGGKIRALATTSDDYLYAITETGKGLNARLMRIGKDDGSWSELSDGGYSMLLSLYADPDGNHVFAGARMDDNNEVYAILHLESSVDSSLKLLESNTALLSGAAADGTNYYLSTILTKESSSIQSGIFYIPQTNLANNSLTLSSGSENRTFMGMIRLKDTGKTIVAVEREGGTLYKVNGSSVEELSIKTEKYATGALALWAADSSATNGTVLVAGRQGGLYYTTSDSYDYGYVEFPLKSDGTLSGESRLDPNGFQSVHDPDRYRPTIGIKPINHLFQAPHDIDPSIRFFASTHNSGLWSYRNRVDSGGWQWNAETN